MGEQILTTCALTLVVFVVVEERLEAVEEKLGSHLGSVVFLKRGWLRRDPPGP